MDNPQLVHYVEWFQYKFAYYFLELIFSLLIVAVLKVHVPLKNEKHTSNNLEGIRVDRNSSTTTDELLQLLRQQARVGQPRPGISRALSWHFIFRCSTIFGVHMILLGLFCSNAF